MTNTNGSVNGTAKAAYKRIVLKLSGEALAGDHGFGIDPDRADFIATKIKEIHDLGVQIAVVIGAGNLWRGSIGVNRGMEQSTADHMGMIGTVMNGLALQDALERVGVETRVQTAVQMNAVAEPYIRLRAIRHLEKGRIVIFGAGIGNPYFTTDSTAALRAIETQSNVVLKGTRVDGVYTADPEKVPTATRYKNLSFQEAYEKNLNIMDMTAFTLCMENKLPIIVFDMNKKGNLLRVAEGEEAGTLIS